MAYSTRRKSVNLSLLGIHVPRPMQRSLNTTVPLDDGISPPSKKIKREHMDASNHDSIPSPPKFALPKPKEVRPSVAVHTPPPSPPPSGEEAESPAPCRKVDTEGINDDVVIATIEVLEKTDNRPHLLKELATAISGHVHVVETSANQSAIISSRLTNFLKRPWTTLAPCPLGKELVGTHPKRLFFFLTTQPRQAIPDPDAASNKNRIISPSLTSVPSEDEDVSLRRRSEMSPSPEVQLTSPDLETADAHMSRSTSFSENVATPTFSQTRESPPMDIHEHEFTQTANSLQQLAESQKEAQDVEMHNAPTFEASSLFEDLEEGSSQRSREFAAVFGQTEDSSFSARKGVFLMSSPMIYPHPEPEAATPKPLPPPLSLAAIEDKMESGFVWTELKSPETLELDELENLFESY